MTIALFGISSIYNGFQKFMNAAAHFENEFSTGRPDTFKTAPTSKPLKTNAVRAGAFPAQQRALRVLRVAEHGETAACAGRMVISGRMADVCAELDRLLALEANHKSTLPH
jgi:hypothetical protein